MIQLQTPAQEGAYTRKRWKALPKEVSLHPHRVFHTLSIHKLLAIIKKQDMGLDRLLL